MKKKVNQPAEGIIELSFSSNLKSADVKEALTVTTAVLEDLIKNFDEFYCDYDTSKKPTKKLQCKKPVKKPIKPVPTKKEAPKGTLMKGEKEKIKILRQNGMPIKAIGKAIHRGEKVVSAYVHSLEKNKKK